MTILEALAMASDRHSWRITNPDGNITVELRCENHHDRGKCHRGYWFTSDNHRAANASCIEAACRYHDDPEHHAFLRKASLSDKWILEPLPPKEAVR